MTDGHKHRIVRINPSTRTGGALYAFLRKPRFHTTDLARVDASPYPYGPCREHPLNWKDAPVEAPECYTLSVLSVLHRWTGLTLVWRNER